MAKDANLNEEEPRAVSPEELAAAEPTETVTEAAPVAAKSRRGIIIGSTIAGGVLAIAIGFGGGYAVGQSQHRGPDFAQQGQMGGFGQGDGDHGGFGGGQRDRDGDHGGFGGGNGGGQFAPNQQNQTQQNQTQQNQSGTGSTGSATTAP